MDKKQENETGPTTYTVRDGTIDYGKDYEVRMCALLSLRCIANKNVTNTWIALSANRHGALDDLVFYVETKDGKNISYLIQLKHGMKGRDIPARDFKTKKKSGFFLEKYYETIKEIKNAIDQNDDTSEIINHLRANENGVIFILFTNRGTTDSNFLKNVPKNSKADLDWSIYEFIDTAGQISLFDYNKLQELQIDDNLKATMEERFFLFTKQQHIDKTKLAIATSIENLIKPLKLAKNALNNVVEKFLTFVTNWSKGELGGHYPLTKTHILKVLFELITQPYTIKLDTIESDEFEFDLWSEIIENKKLIVIEEDDLVLRFLNSFILGEVRKYCLDPKNVSLWKKHPERFRKDLLRPVDRAKNIRESDAYEFLWKSLRVPLILQINSTDLKNILNFLKMQDYRLICLVKTKELLPNTTLSSLKDFNKEKQQKILDFPVKLQGRSQVCLNNFKLDQKHFSLLTMKDIIYILSKQFNIGQHPEALPEFFIERPLETILLQGRVLEISNETFFIKCQSIKDFQLFLDKHNLQIAEYRMFRWQNNNAKELENQEIIIFETQSLEDLTTLALAQNRTTHLLVLDKQNLQWVKSFGSIINLRSFREESHYEALMEFSGKTNLISAFSGMGKTIFLNWLALNTPTDWWVIKIIFLEHVSYLKNKNLSNLEAFDHLKYFGEMNLKNNQFDKEIFGHYLNASKIVLLLDAFDEIPISCQKQTEQLIKTLNQSKACIFLTTKPISRNQLEETLNTFALSLKPFTKSNQKKFLMNYFGKINDEAENLNYVQLLLNAAQDNLNDQDQEFTGVPLQTKLLAEVFASDYQEFVVTKKFQNRRFDLVYLYETFIDKKTKIFCQKFGDAYEDLLHQYQTHRSLYALRYLFEEDDLKELKVEEELNQMIKHFPSALQLIQKDGIVITHGRNEVTFVHRTFAEFFAAKWLSNNLKNKHVQKLCKKTFHPTFTVLRNFFDRMLARNCPLHLAIINHRYDLATEIINGSQEVFDVRDEGGRTFLHLMPAWEIYHSHKEKNYEDIQKLKKLIPAKHIPNPKDSLFNYTPLEYAICFRETIFFAGLLLLLSIILLILLVFATSRNAVSRLRLDTMCRSCI